MLEDGRRELDLVLGHGQQQLECASQGSRQTRSEWSPRDPLLLELVKGPTLALAAGAVWTALTGRDSWQDAFATTAVRLAGLARKGSRKECPRVLPGRVARHLAQEGDG